VEALVVDALRAASGFERKNEPHPPPRDASVRAGLSKGEIEVSDSLPRYSSMAVFHAFAPESIVERGLQPIDGPAPRAWNGTLDFRWRFDGSRNVEYRETRGASYARAGPADE